MVREMAHPLEQVVFGRERFEEVKHRIGNVKYGDVTVPLTLPLLNLLKGKV